LRGEADSGFMSGNFEDFLDGNGMDFDQFINDKGLGSEDATGNEPVAAAATMPGHPDDYTPIFDDVNDNTEDGPRPKLPPPPVPATDNSLPKPALRCTQPPQPASPISVSSPRIA